MDRSFDPGRVYVGVLQTYVAHASRNNKMIKSTLAFYCAVLFLFFYNCTTRLDDEFATGTIEAMVDNLRATRRLEATQRHYRQVMGQVK
jgi:hypothetical protein